MAGLAGPHSLPCWQWYKCYNEDLPEEWIKSKKGCEGNLNSHTFYTLCLVKELLKIKSIESVLSICSTVTKIDASNGWCNLREKKREGLHEYCHQNVMLFLFPVGTTDHVSLYNESPVAFLKVSWEVLIPQTESVLSISVWKLLLFPAHNYFSVIPRALLLSPLPSLETGFFQLFAGLLIAYYLSSWKVPIRNSKLYLFSKMLATNHDWWMLQVAYAGTVIKVMLRLIS